VLTHTRTCTCTNQIDFSPSEGLPIPHGEGVFSPPGYS